MKQLFITSGILAAVFSSLVLHNKKPVEKPASPKEWSARKAQKDIAGNDIKLLTFGLPIPCLDYNKLTQKYGFRYEELGCMPSLGDDKMDIAAYNTTVIAYLNKRNGTQWKNKLSAEVDSADKNNPCFQ